MLDDLVDKGYIELNEVLTGECNGVTRLKKYLDIHHAKPFELRKNSVKEAEKTLAEIKTMM